MRLYRQHAFGGPETLALEEGPEPERPARGYLVSVRAAAVNFADLVDRRGRYRRGQTLLQMLGKEASGVIVARGSHASQHRLGDAVIALKLESGCCAEVIAAEEDQVLPAPPGFDFVELAAFAASDSTAWHALREVARARAGDALLVQAAAGALGTAAVLLGRAMGCHPIIGTASTDDTCTYVLSLGAIACIPYMRQDFRSVVRQLTNGRGADVCLETVDGSVYDDSVEVLAPLGRLVVLGFSSTDRDHGQRIPRMHPLTLMHRSISVGGLDVDALAIHTRRAQWTELTEFCATHKIRPVVGATFPFEDADKSHSAVESRSTREKIVLVLDGARLPVTSATS